MEPTEDDITKALDRAIAILLITMDGIDGAQARLDAVVAVHETIMFSASPELHARAEAGRAMLRERLRKMRERVGPPPGRPEPS